MNQDQREGGVTGEVMDYSDLPREDTWVEYLRTRLPYSFSEIHEQNGQYMLSEPLLSTRQAKYHNFWKRGYVFYAVGKLGHAKRTDQARTVSNCAPETSKDYLCIGRSTAFYTRISFGIGWPDKQTIS